MNEALRRVFFNLAPKATDDDYFSTVRASMVLSADTGHSIHPNYPEKHQQSHQVKMNSGVCFKINCNQRYMTDSTGLAIFRALAEMGEVPMQDMAVRQDMRTGSTIGPFIAGLTGIKTVDIGIPILSMHSIRETSGVLDILYLKKLYTIFLQKYSKISQDLLSC